MNCNVLVVPVIVMVVVMGGSVKSIRFEQSRVEALHVRNRNTNLLVQISAGDP
jgi:hypothetical protein